MTAVTAPAIQQTAPLVVTVLDRCEIGKSVLKARALAVKAAATMDDFFVAEGKGWKKYCKHVSECETCQTFEMWKRSEQDKRFGGTNDTRNH